MMQQVNGGRQASTVVQDNSDFEDPKEYINLLNTVQRENSFTERKMQSSDSNNIAFPSDSAMDTQEMIRQLEKYQHVNSVEESPPEDILPRNNAYVPTIETR